MKKTKLKTVTGKSKASSPAKSAAGNARDLGDVRRQIASLVADGAVGMVEITMEEVGKGHYLGMKYLFEMIGLYPVGSTDDAPAADSLAAILLRRLGLPETPLPESGVTEDSVLTAAVSEDALE
jgi:hypothetical protein